MGKMNSEILLERLKKYAIDCQKVTLLLTKSEYNTIYSRQIIRSSSSPAANYIEAIEASTGKEFAHRLKISRKETKESNYWLEMIRETNSSNADVKTRCNKLISEGVEFIKIFTSSIITSERNQKLKSRK